MKIEQFEIWIADLNPRMGTEAGKSRPVLIIQTNLLNSIPHPSTLICPLTTRISDKAEILRVYLAKGTAQLDQPCDVMLDQVRAIDNRRLVKKTGRLPEDLVRKVRDNLKIVFDL